jgi:hypothetical protein
MPAPIVPRCVRELAFPPSTLAEALRVYNALTYGDHRRDNVSFVFGSSCFEQAQGLGYLLTDPRIQPMRN